MGKTGSSQLIVHNRFQFPVIVILTLQKPIGMGLEGIRDSIYLAEELSFSSISTVSM